MSNINRIFIPKKGQSLKNGSVPSLGFTPTISIADWMSSVLASPILCSCFPHPLFLLPPSFFPFFPSYPCPCSYLSVVCLTINKTDM